MASARESAAGMACEPAASRRDIRLSSLLAFYTIKYRIETLISFRVQLRSLKSPDEDAKT